MNMTNLANNIGLLISFMVMSGYSDHYIRILRTVTAWILEHATGNTWTSYKDIYEQYASSGYSESYLRNCLSAFKILEDFDIRNKYPDGKPGVAHDAYEKLVPEFKEVVDFAINEEVRHGLKPSTCDTRRRNTSGFFLAMQNLGHQTVDTITEKDVLSFFVDDTDDDIKLLRGQGPVSSIRSFLRDSLPWHDGACGKLLAFLPETRRISKNVQYLTDDEVMSIQNVIDRKELSLRDTAMVSLLLETGMRACDITGLKFSNIDWENEKISVIQQKTGISLVLPLTPTVGNFIYDYIESERPKVDSEFVFLREVAPWGRIYSHGLRKVVDKLFFKAGIRQTPGERRGTHIFRHRVATELLESGTDRATIAAVLGQGNPSSLNPYLHADMVHLKECTLDVSAFSLSGEVFDED